MGISSAAGRLFQMGHECFEAFLAVKGWPTPDDASHAFVMKLTVLGVHFVVRIHALTPWELQHHSPVTGAGSSNLVRLNSPLVRNVLEAAGR